jgi:hypothetical protein
VNKPLLRQILGIGLGHDGHPVFGRCLQNPATRYFVP